LFHPKERLYLRLAEELALGVDSAWAPYLEMLPAMPVGAFGFTDTALSLLELTASVPLIAEWQHAADAMYHNINTNRPVSLPEVHNAEYIMLSI
jgi:hypothetical protein